MYLLITSYLLINTEDAAWIKRTNSYPHGVYILEMGAGNQQKYSILGGINASETSVAE